MKILPLLASAAIIISSGCSATNSEFNWNRPRSELPKNVKVGILIGSADYEQANESYSFKRAFHQIEEFAKYPEKLPIHRPISVGRRGTNCLVDSSDRESDTLDSRIFKQHNARLPNPVRSCLDTSLRYHWIWGQAWKGAKLEWNKSYTNMQGFDYYSLGFSDYIHFQHGIWDDSLREYVAEGVESKKVKLFTFGAGSKVVKSAALERPLFPRNQIADGISLTFNPLRGELNATYDYRRLSAGFRKTPDGAAVLGKVLAICGGRPNSYSALYGSFAYGQDDFYGEEITNIGFGPTLRMKLALFVFDLGVEWRLTSWQSGLSYIKVDPEFSMGFQF